MITGTATKFYGTRDNLAGLSLSLTDFLATLAASLLSSCTAGAFA
jgi:hypothetical protein